MDGPAPLTWSDLSDLPEAEYRQMYETTRARMRERLDLAHGPLLQVVYFHLGAGRPGRLLLTVHGLVADESSWPILLEDLHTAYEQASAGLPIRLPPKTAAMERWARRLDEHAQSDAVRDELAYWRAVLDGPPAHLPLDDPAGGADTAGVVTVALDTDETRALVEELPAAYRTAVEDALLAALAQALNRWTGAPSALIDLARDGRRELFEDVDLARTVGPFVTLFPVRLDVGADAEPGAALPAVKEYLRQVPNQGAGYGLLRYGRDDTRTLPQGLPRPEVCLTYVTPFDQILPTTVVFGAALDDNGQTILQTTDAAPRAYLLEVRAAIVDGRLQVEWTHTDAHRPVTIERIAQDFVVALRALIAHSQSPDAAGYTASDFAEFDWSPDDLEDIIGEITRLG
jgi:non-ribosomal peptide synthase protein (TIGR01720 family)